MKSSKKCYYCGKDVIGQRRYFCSDVCNNKYWAGVYSKKWKEGSFANKRKPTKTEILITKKKTQARKLAYKKYQPGKAVKCDMCPEVTKDVHRHHEDYNRPEIFMVVCTKCHGFIKRYNSLKKILYSNKEVKK